jgi:hypothetical protein
MNPTKSLLAALVLASSSVLAGAAEPAKNKPIVVDPMDLRAPVPDPEKELFEKYDGKLVVFTGNLQSAGRDATSNQRWYTLAVPVIQEQKRGSKPRMQTVAVKVYFASNERRLPTRPAHYTIEGIGEITVDGSLIIRNARTVSVVANSSATKR